MGELLSIGLIVIEQYILISYIAANFKSKYKSEMIYAVYVAVASSIAILINPIYDNMLMRLLINGVLCTVLLMLIYEEDIKHIVCTYGIFIGIAFTIDVIVFAGIGIIFPGIMQQLEQNVLIGYLSKSILFVVITLLGRKNIKETFLPNKYLIIITITYMLSIVVTFGIMNQMVHEDRILLLLLMIFMFWVNAFNIYMYLISMRYFQKKQYTDTLKRIMEVQHKYTLQNQNSVEEIRKIKHDLNNKLIGLLFLMEQKQYDKARAYILELNEQIDNIETGYVTGHSIIDFILNQKSALCREKRIKLYLEKVNIDELKVNIEDISNVLGNSLDNAIEAASQAEGKEKSIWAEIYTRKGYLVISIKNTFKPGSIKEGLVTTKKEEGHGIGIKSMRESIEKYDGDMILDYKENIFMFKATMENRAN